MLRRSVRQLFSFCGQLRHAPQVPLYECEHFFPTEGSYDGEEEEARESEESEGEERRGEDKRGKRRGKRRGEERRGEERRGERVFPLLLFWFPLQVLCESRESFNVTMVQHFPLWILIVAVCGQGQWWDHGGLLKKWDKEHECKCTACDESNYYDRFR